MSEFPYTLDPKIERNMLLSSRVLRKRRPIVTIEKILLLCSQGKINDYCIIIQRGYNFVALENRHLALWFIQLRNLYYTDKESWYRLTEDILSIKINPWNFELNCVNQEYLDAINDIIDRHKWIHSVFHDQKIINLLSVKGYWNIAKYNMHGFIFTLSLIAYASDQAELYHPKHCNISVAGYFKREILKDLMFKIIERTYPIAGGPDDERYCKHDDISKLIRDNSKKDNENLDEYAHRMDESYAEVIVNWYYRQEGEYKYEVITRIDRSIIGSNNARSICRSKHKYKL